jgi:hypothetical protein
MITKNSYLSGLHGRVMPHLTTRRVSSAQQQRDVPGLALTSEQFTHQMTRTITMKRRRSASLDAVHCGAKNNPSAFRRCVC